MAPIVSLLTLALAVASAGPAELVSANSGLEERSNSGPGHIYCTFDVQSGKFAPDGVERDIIAADVKCKRHTAYKRDLQPNWAGLQNVPSVRGPFGPIIAGKMGDKITYKVRNALTSTEAQKRMAALERPAGQMRKSTVPDSALEGLSSSERRQAVYGRVSSLPRWAPKLPLLGMKMTLTRGLCVCFCLSAPRRPQPCIRWVGSLARHSTPSPVRPPLSTFTDSRSTTRKSLMDLLSVSLLFRDSNKERWGIGKSLTQPGPLRPCSRRKNFG